MRGLPKLVDVQRIAGGRKLILETAGERSELEFGTGGCFVGDLTQVSIGRFQYDDDEALKHELIVTLKNEREEYSTVRAYFEDPKFIKVRLDATRHDATDLPRHPQLLTYEWQGEDLALTFRTPEGEIREQMLGGPDSSLPYKLHGTIWPYRRLAREAMMDKEIVFTVEGPEGITPLVLLCDNALTVYEYVLSRTYPKAEAAVIPYAYLQAA